MNARSVISLIPLSLALLPPALAAQDTLAPIVVTATRLPTPRDQIAGTITVLDGAALRERGTQLADALREVPGLHLVQSGGPGMVTSLFLRGGESDYVKVLVDGVALNQPGGSFDLAGLSTDNIERVEILRGPASVLYGSDAVTGVINIITRPAVNGFTGSAGIRGGTYGTTEASAQLAGGSARTGWSFAGSRTFSDGLYQLNSRWRSVGAAGTLHARGRRSDALISLRVGDNALRYPTDFSGQPVDSNQHSLGINRHVTVDLGRRWTDRAETRLILGWHDDRLVTDNPPDALNPDGFSNTTDFGRWLADGSTHWRVGRAVLTGGVAAEYQDFRNHIVSTGFFPSDDTLEASRRAIAGYAQALAQLSDAVHLVAGARFESARRSDSMGDRLHQAATWRLGASARVSSSTRLRGTVGTSFKEPTFFEQFGSGFSTGNPGLDPERSFSAELGLERALGRRARVSVTAFMQRFEDLIQFQFVTPAPGDPNYVNVGGARASGLELEAVVYPGAALTLGARWTFLHTEATDSSIDGYSMLPGERMLRRPTNAGGVFGTARFPRGVTVHLSGQYTGDRLDLDFAGPDPRITLPAYVRVDGGIAWQPGRLRLSVQVENLLDEDYEEVRFYPARGRTLMAGVRAAI